MQKRLSHTQEPPIIEIIENTSWAAGILCILSAIIMFFFEQFYSLVLLLVGVGIIYIELRIFNYLERDVNRERIKKIIECGSCNGTGKNPDVANVQSYGLSESCQTCLGKEQNKPTQFLDLNKLYSKHDIWYHNQANGVKSQKEKFDSFGHVVKIHSRVVI